MRISMPRPVKHGEMWWLRVRIPADVKEKAKGMRITIPVAEEHVSIKLSDTAKTSLRTKDWQEAKRRFAETMAALEDYWRTLRQDVTRLSHKQAVALAGEVRADFITIMDDNPGSPRMWDQVAEADVQATQGQINPLTAPSPQTIANDLETRFGGFADAIIARHRLRIDAKSRLLLLHRMADAMQEVTQVNRAKALGDYSDDGATDRYPEFVQAPKETKASRLTFGDVIDREVKRRSLGREKKPMPRKTEDKYRKVAAEFAAHRGSDDVRTITVREADNWKVEMLEGEKLSNSTINQRLHNLKTIVKYAMQHELGELFPHGNPLDKLTIPERNFVDSADRTFTMAEARKILLAARQETRKDLRWLPWICAYSGARINEAAQLTPSDFFELDGQWFYRLNTKGGRSLKTTSSIRRVPVHPSLLAEGLMNFIQSHPMNSTDRMFTVNANDNVGKWVKNSVVTNREKLPPNHGWRHLFEDLAMSSEIRDSAKLYIAGRASGKSAESYGKSDVMLKGLAEEMKKIPSIL